MFDLCKNFFTQEQPNRIISPIRPITLCMGYSASNIYMMILYGIQSK